MSPALTLLRRMAGAAMILAGNALAGPAFADTRLVEGHSLALTSTLDETVSVSVDPTLHGAVRLSMADGLDCVSATGSGEVVITTARCGSDTSGLDVAIPAGMPVSLTIAGSGEVHLGDLRAAPLTATVASSGDLKARAVTALTLTIRGSGDVSFTEADGPVTVASEASGDLRIARLRGTLNLRQSGSGDVIIGNIAAGDVDVVGGSSGDLLIGNGSIGQLRAQRSGNGDMVVAALAATADVSATGGGDIKLARVAGTLNRNASGGSDIVVGGSAVLSQIEGQVARAVGSASDTGDHVTVHTGGGFSMVKHFVTMGVVIVVLIMVWRAISRAGGLSAIRNRVGGTPPPGIPSHPGVLGLAETMQRLEQRMARVEGYVTSREFDLQQKFRDLK